MNLQNIYIFVYLQGYSLLYINKYIDILKTFDNSCKEKKKQNQSLRDKLLHQLNRQFKCLRQRSRN